MSTIRRILILLFSLILLYSLYVMLIRISDYNPNEIVILPIKNNQSKTVKVDETLTVTTFNIGHAGLDQYRDFYNYGGKSSRAISNEAVLSNLEGIVTTLDQINSDFLLLQEVDTNSSRSYKNKELEYFNIKYPNYSCIYGKNYDIAWIPFPLLRPMGMVESGISTFSKFNAYEANRYDLPGQEDGIYKFFDYDRCFTEQKFKTKNGKSLIVINLHLSDFKDVGFKRQLELSYLEHYLEKIRKEDSYIIVGGDWNHNLPGSDPYHFNFIEDWPSWLKNLPEVFTLDGFNWSIDTRYPTVRSLEYKYNPGSTFLAVIDGFLVSDNIEVLDVETVNENFKYSYHNPVKLSFSLK